MATPYPSDLVLATREGSASQSYAIDTGAGMPEAERLDIGGVVVGQAVARAKLERAKSFRRAGTCAERLLWQCLRGNQLEGLHFRRQQVLDGLILDFYCHAARLAVEVDGAVHNGQMEYDGERDRVLALRGIRVLRVQNEHVEASLPSVLELILKAAKEPIANDPGWPSPLPAPGRGTGG